MTLIEVLVSTMIALFIGVGLLALISTHMIGVFNTQGQSVVDVNSRQAVDIMADKIRNAQPYNSTSPAALEAATTNSISPYTDTAGDYVRYWLDTTSSSLKSTVGTTTTVVASNVTSLQFTYYTSGGNYTPAAASWSTTANSHSPLTSELPSIAAVGMQLTMTQNGYTRTFYTIIRLRNSPVNPPAYG
jgi:Tfp pilus assembly protein PilV